ncbi:MAG: hypothetical protein U5K99_01100 [Anaerolineales bacterium]|nr:hypothetical protein [Anaerolineales bacterium]
MNLSLIIVVGAALLLVLIVVLTVKGRQKKQEASAKRARSLGFQLLEEVPIQLQERMEKLVSRGSGKRLELRSVYQQRGFDQDFYLVDVKEHGDDQVSWMGPETMVVISSRLALPRFTVISLPETGEGGVVEGLAEKMLDQVMQWLGKTRGLNQVVFPDQPEFQRRFGLLARNEQSVRHFFSRHLTQYLIQMNQAMGIEAEGDFFAVSLTSPGEKPDGDPLQDLYRTARDLARAFKTGA